MTIYYWTSFTKRKNSTKQPSSGTSLTVRLKEGTSIETPTFLLTGDKFDIVYVKAFSDHYYFVTDIKSVKNGLTEISCKMDALATFKSTIGSYSAFVERSSYTNNPWIPDEGCSMLPYTVTSTSYVDTLFDSTGVFALSVLNDLGSGVGFTTTYLMNKDNLAILANYCNTDYGSLVTDPLAIVEWLQAVMFKTASMIVDCIWIPLPYSGTYSNLSQLETVKVGVDNVTGCQGYRVMGNCVSNKSYSITLPTPTHANDFRSYAPYTLYKLYIPGYGVVDINQADFYNGLNMTYDTDMVTGDTMVYLYSSTKIISSYHINIGVSCPVGKVGADVTGTITNTLGMAANIATARIPGNRYADVSKIEAVSSGISALTSALGPTSSVSGSKGGRAVIASGKTISVTMLEHDTITPADYNPTSGLMLMEQKQISSIPGYIKCINASVPISGMEAERDEINSFLNSGFYYE